MPARFRFRLQPVLEMRERAEREHQVRVAKVEAERVQLENLLRTIQAEAAQAREYLRDRLLAPDSGVGLSAVRLQANASLHTNLRAQRAAIELAGTLKRLEAARSDLLTVSAARQAVQKLKERRFVEHNDTLRRAEAASLDELTVMRHARGNDAATNLLESAKGDQP